MKEEIDNIKNKRGYLNRDFEFFHIKDKKDLEFEFHYHDFNKIIIFISGKVTYSIEGKSYKLRPWDILLVNSNEIHKPIIDAGETYERIIIWVNSDFIIKHNSSSCNLFHCFELASNEKINLLRLDCESLQNMKNILYGLEEAKYDVRFGNNILSNSLFLQFLVYLNRLFLERRNEDELSDIQYDESIGKILDYINENLSEDLSIEALSSIFYISKYYLMHKFKMQTGYTVHNYILQKRLIMANSLIKDGCNITEAAIESGFKDYSSFVRTFKKKFGASPKNYSKIR